MALFCVKIGNKGNFPNQFNWHPSRGICILRSYFSNGKGIPKKARQERGIWISCYWNYNKFKSSPTPTLFFHKNIFYKGIKAGICRKIKKKIFRINLRLKMPFWKEYIYIYNFVCWKFVNKIPKNSNNSNTSGIFDGKNICAKRYSIWAL